MKQLTDYIEDIHSCSKCGLCQSVCPLYKITGNDCTVARGQFIMLYGLLKKQLKMTKNLNRYLDLCLKCGACSKFCPSGLGVVDIIACAKAEYFKISLKEKLCSFFQKYLIFGFGIKFFNILSYITFKHRKSRKFNTKVVYFGGCGAKLDGNVHIVKILNAIGIEVITPDFDCCGIPFFVRGDLETFQGYMNKFYKILNTYGVYDIVTNCASCEKTIKSYAKWMKNTDNKYPNINVKNIFEYIKDYNVTLELKKTQKVTFHKPCNLNNFEDVKWILQNTKNLEYIQMEDYDKCCGLNGVSKLSEYKIMSKLFKEKHYHIKSSGTKKVLTSCLGCKTALNLFSFGQYKVQDFTEFLAKNIK